MTETLGKIASEARHAWELQYTETGHYDPDWREKCDEHVAAAIIEECAKVTEQLSDLLDKGTVENIAAVLRSLATSSEARLKSATRDTVGSEHASASLTQNKTETAE